MKGKKDRSWTLTYSTLQAVCNRVVMEPKKAVRKFPRVQHLHARLAGTLRSEDDEVRENSHVSNKETPFTTYKMNVWFIFHLYVVEVAV